MTEEDKAPTAPTPGELVDRSGVAPGARGRGRGLKQESWSAPLAAAMVKPVSQRKLEANRANAKKSTGARTGRGKAHSRRNAVRHGLTSTTVLFRPDGPHDADLRQLWERLHEKFGSGDAITDALIDNAVAECSHQVEALKLEKGFSEMATSPRPISVGVANFHRYLTKSRRALHSTLRLLRHRVAKG